MQNATIISNIVPGGTNSSSQLGGILITSNLTAGVGLPGAKGDTGGVNSVNAKTGTVTLTQDDIASGTTNKVYTATEQTKLAAITGTNTGDQDLSSYATTTNLSLKAATTYVDSQDALKVSKTGDTMTGQLSLSNSSTNASLQLTQTGNASSSTSIGGALNLNNTGSTGAGVVVYSAQASPAGHLLVSRADNANFNQSAIYADYNGVANAVNVNNSGSGTSNGALNVGSTNASDSTIKVNGVETGRGTIKVTHTGTGTDANASGLSINLTGTGTAAQGIYVDSDTNTTGMLLRLRNGGVDKLTVSSSGDLSVSGAINNSFFQPSDLGLLSWAYDPAQAVNTQILATAGTMYVVKLVIPKSISVTNLNLYITTAGVTLSNCYAALYQGGTLIGQTADQSTVWNSAGLKTMALTGGPFTVSAGTVYVGFWANGTTLPVLARAGGSGVVNIGFTSTTSRFGSANTGLTATAPSSLGTVGALSVAYWCAIS